MIRSTERQVVGSIPILGNKILNVFISSFWNEDKALSSTTQHAMPREFSGKWGGVNEVSYTRVGLGSLCLLPTLCEIKILK